MHQHFSIIFVEVYFQNNNVIICHLSSNVSYGGEQIMIKSQAKKYLYICKTAQDFSRYSSFFIVAALFGMIKE